MSSWFDTETKALLQKSPPEKLAPPDTALFTLVVLAVSSHDQLRVTRAIERIAHNSPVVAGRVLMQTPPFPVKTGLSYPDALLGQFELISSDAISVFLDDEIFKGASPEYLQTLFANLLESPEFELVSVQVGSIPATEQGKAFLDQFFGSDDSWRSHALKLPRKKARIMEHWAKKIGGVVTWKDA